MSMPPAMRRGHEERAFRGNPWSFAKKKACRGLVGDVEPSFGSSEAYIHFATITKGTNSRYNTPENSGLPLSIDEVMPSPNSDRMTHFDLSAITSGSIKGPHEKVIQFFTWRR